MKYGCIELMKKPIVTLIMATTLDGKIAKDSEHFPDWTGKADMKYFVQRTKEIGVVIMGSKTFKTINKGLKDRLLIVMTRIPEKFEKIEGVQFTNNSPEEILERLAGKGVEEVALAGGRMINTLFVEKNLIDRAELTISPLIFGQGMGVFADGVEVKMELELAEKLSEEVVKVHYKIKK